MRLDVGNQVQVQVRLSRGNISVIGLFALRRGEAGVVQRGFAVLIPPCPAIHAVADGIILMLSPCLQASRQEGSQHTAVEPIGNVVERIVIIEIEWYGASGLVRCADKGVDVQPIDNAADVVRAECQIHQQRVVIRRSRLGAELDEASAEQLVHLRRTEVLRHGCADDGAVIVVIPGNTITNTVTIPAGTTGTTGGNGTGANGTNGTGANGTTGTNGTGTNADGTTTPGGTDANGGQDADQNGTVENPDEQTPQDQINLDDEDTPTGNIDAGKETQEKNKTLGVSIAIIVAAVVALIALFVAMKRRKKETK